MAATKSSAPTTNAPEEATTKCSSFKFTKRSTGDKYQRPLLLLLYPLEQTQQWKPSCPCHVAAARNTTENELSPNRPHDIAALLEVPAPRHGYSDQVYGDLRLTEPLLQASGGWEHHNRLTTPTRCIFDIFRTHLVKLCLSSSSNLLQSVIDIKFLSISALETSHSIIQTRS
jgi:hypothetical protein